MSERLRQRWSDCQFVLRGHQRILVAFSAGCDSTFLAAAARRCLGRGRVLAVTAVSASLAAADKTSALRLAVSLDLDHLFVETREFDNPLYTSNPTNRCFYCKDELFSRLSAIAASRRMVVADGFTVSDRSDFRPGLQAAQRWNVAHPLDAAGLDKLDIRALSRWMKLPTWNKPASPCLSSRIPYGTPVVAPVLRQIERAETFLRDSGFAVVRVRHFGRQARIEVPLPDLPRLLESAQWQRTIRYFKTIGYEETQADPRGFRSGRLNGAELLSDAHAYGEN